MASRCFRSNRVAYFAPLGIWGSAFSIILNTLKDERNTSSEEKTKKELGKFINYYIHPQWRI